MNKEPRNEDIEDYDGKESIEKKLTVWLSIVSILLAGAAYGLIMLSMNCTN